MNRSVKTVLLTGFEPFGGDSDNPSWQAVQALHGHQIAGHRVVTRLLPVAFSKSLRALRAALNDSSPAVVICVGQAGGRAQISLERVAINVDDARIPDNAGKQPVDVPVIDNGPAAYFSTLPIKNQLLALREAGIPAEISQSAGTYVCNHVFYGLMHTLRNKKLRAGFIHIPYSPAQASLHPGAASMSIEQVSQALRICVRVALDQRQDQAIAAGAEC
ncbi:pyroglutamyl-peptidase I [Pseudoxanthomonas dokdonensis]|uniref:Pyrrolidone-carboxylate peptidase n=1 Tax=Pseudoxanthomonas dokdonensis TaxID=344882 RepID=A0A0R0CIA2_9GAMM|nr:pyroglutamyl-peptidase I [Pseudoxanthomonas dokdonensis]KRG68918.1 pyrrolidone-carboxylate peptidase [Pseudoxanthomonas dokdonensis]